MNNSLAFGVSQDWGWEIPVLFVVRAGDSSRWSALAVRATVDPAPAPTG